MKEFASSPFHVGSICPSSRWLALRLVGVAQKAALAASTMPEEGLILDLGAGSGPVTRELLRAGVSPQRIVAIERSRSFGAAFKRKYRHVPLLVGDAAHLRALLADAYPNVPIAAVISSLPFRSIPRKITEAILLELRQTLTERGGALVQYSYAWWMKDALLPYGFTPLSSHLVIQNFPPARVEAYRATPCAPRQMFLNG